MPESPSLAAIEVRVDGEPLALDELREVRVDHSVALPNAFLIRLADPELEQIDREAIKIGAAVEILCAPIEHATVTSLIKGQVVALEPEFARGEATLTARGYDRSHALARTTRSRAFQQMTYGDIVTKVASEAGLQAGQIDTAGGLHDFVQQSNETDWSFLWRLASAIDFELTVDGERLDFRGAGAEGAGEPVPLRWGEELLQFRPRVTGVQQVDDVVVQGWEPIATQPIEATARPERVDAGIGIGRDEVAAALDGGTVRVTDRPVATQEEADALASSVAARLSNAYVEADGVALGEPRLRAGAVVRIDGVGAKFGGTYRLSATSHVHRGSAGYHTRFRISGRSSGTLIDLVTAAGRRRWGEGLVIGTVTNNEDPDGLGRVRVKYPVLGDDLEGWWARIASPSAGSRRGLLMMPQPGDEVVIGFEHGDVRRPYVLGALWNGQAKPEELFRADGSFALRSDEEIDMEAAGPIKLTGGEDLTLKVEGNADEQVTGNAALKADGELVLQSSSQLTIESSGPLSIKAGGSLKLECSGVVQISGSQVMLG